MEESDCHQMGANDGNGKHDWLEKKEPTCTTHPGKKLKYYDEDCKQMLCSACAVVNHSGHKCSTLADTAKKCKDSNSSKIAQVQKQVQELKEAENLTTGVMHSLDQNYQHGVDLINAETNKVQRKNEKKLSLGRLD